MIKSISSRNFPLHAAGLLLFLGMLAAYFPVVAEKYAFHDDLFLWNAGTSCHEHPQFYPLIANGRFLFGIVSCPVWMWVRSLESLRWTRFFVLLGFSLGGFFYITFLMKCSLKAGEALLISLITLAMPCFQTQLIFAGTWAHSMTLLGAILSGWLWKRSMLKAQHYRDFLAQPSTWISIGSLFCALALYTPLAMFYWVLVAAHLLFDEKEDPKTILRHMAYAFLIFALAAGPFFVVAKCLYLKFSHDPRIPVGFLNGHEVQLISLNQIKSKIYIFLHGALRLALRLWDITPSSILSKASLLLILLALTLESLRRSWAVRLKLALLISLLPLLQLPNIMARSYFYSFRMICPLTAFVILLLTWSLKSLVRIKSLVIASLCIAAFFSVKSAHWNIKNYVVEISKTETKTLKEELAKGDLNHIEQIHVIHSPYTNLSRRADIPSDEYGFITSSSDADIPGFVQMGLAERGLPFQKRVHIKITQSLLGERFPSPSNRLLVIRLDRVDQYLPK